MDENFIKEGNLIIDETQSMQKAPESCVKNAIAHENATSQRIDYSFNHSYDGNDKTSYFHERNYSEVITLKLPESFKAHDIKSIEFIGSQQTKSSWGSRPYYGHNINSLIENKSFIEIAGNNSTCSYNDAFDLRKEYFEVLNTKDWDGSAVFISKQKVIFNWFFWNDEYYIQICYSQYAETWGSAVGGAMWINLGSGITLNLYD